MGFPIFRLPWLLFCEVVEHLTLFELTDLCQLSKKTRREVKSVFPDKLKMTLEWRDDAFIKVGRFFQVKIRESSRNVRLPTRIIGGVEVKYYEYGNGNCYVCCFEKYSQGWSIMASFLANTLDAEWKA
ncbi:hypothetical protein B9Z55_012638 [Caenorhabditis nigoni]|uniref:F-box domain-containing protein n=1 Tax=Caenorhabditis nigoni TaxID=1611254 RepID=A0A2G5TZ68_9PELO|nr:hypothetical protein B9Z55_012638 [Caenorhabditis nigoni]